jgi:hypothetical protein
MNVELDRQGVLRVVGISAGVATGFVAGLWLWRRRTVTEPFSAPSWTSPRGSAQDVAAELARDAKLGRRRIEVDAVAEGVVELTGSVRDRVEAERAVGIAQGTTGVYTVVNRLRVEAEESHRESTRRRWADGAPELRERKVYGMGVGMGAGRHAPETDPDRPSDKQKMVERELDVDRVEDAPETTVNPVSGAEAVEDPFMKPGDERAIREAGLDPSPRPTSMPRESGSDAAVDGEPEGEAEQRT